MPYTITEYFFSLVLLFLCYIHFDPFISAQILFISRWSIMAWFMSQMFTLFTASRFGTKLFLSRWTYLLQRGLLSVIKNCLLNSTWNFFKFYCKCVQRVFFFCVCLFKYGYFPLSGITNVVDHLRHTQFSMAIAYRK